MTYQESIQFLENLQKFGDEPGLHRMEKMLSALNNPHRNLKYVHVTGTNGKGSTASSIASIVFSSGYDVGLYTSPHLHFYNERIKVNDVDITDTDFIRYLEMIRTVLKNNPEIRPALFEVMTVMAFLYFSEKNVDVAILEVGIGGRLDSTNIIDGLVSVITNIDLEHTEILGNTKNKIALDKAGIIKSDSIVVTAESDPEIQAIFESEAKKLNAKLRIVSSEDIHPQQQNVSGQVFDFRKYKNLEIPFLGNHQLFNTSLAILVAESLNKKGFEKIKEETIRIGLKNAKWPLRLELVHEAPAILIDVGHNPHGVYAIKKTVEEVFQNSKKILVLGCSFDKPYQKMSKMLSTVANTIIVTKANYHGVEPDEIMKNIDKSNKVILSVNTVHEALMEAKKLSDADSLIMVLGSLYLGAEANEIINKIF